MRGVGYRFRDREALLRSVGARLSLALLLVVAVALALVYLIVVPSLESRLVDRPGRRSSSRRAARLGHELHDERGTPSRAEIASGPHERRRARGRRLPVLSRAGVPLVDSRTRRRLSRQRRRRTTRSSAARSRSRTAAARHRARRASRRYAEVAVPVRGRQSYVLLLATRSTNRSRASTWCSAACCSPRASPCCRAPARLRRRRDVRAADPAARARGRADRGRALRRAGRRPRRRRARRARAAFERMRVRLAQLDHARREFIANASHELRTPLFSLGGFLELLDDEELDEATRREFLATMREQVDRLTKLADRSARPLAARRGPAHRRARAGRPRARWRETLVEEFGPLARRERSRARGRCPGAPSVAEADELRVLQIGRILVENALVHTPPGTAVRVRTRNRRGTGGARGRGRGHRDPGRAAGAGLRALLPSRRRRGPPERPRAGDRAGAGGADGRRDRARIRARRTVFTLVLPPAAAGAEPFSRENGSIPGHVATVRQPCEPRPLQP